MVIVRSFLPMPTIKKWEVHQMDVHNVFLHGDLVEGGIHESSSKFSKLWPKFGL